MNRINPFNVSESHSKNNLIVNLQSCLHLEAFKSNTTSDWINRMV